MALTIHEQLVGEWVTDPSDSASLMTYGSVSMCFKKNGTLIYRSHSPEGTNVVYLTYELDGNVLITNQISRPQEEKTLFWLTRDGKLVLKYGDFHCSFLRKP